MWFVKTKLGMDAISFLLERFFFPIQVPYRKEDIKLKFCSCSQAQVSGPAEEENRSEFLLKQYDYFGHGGKDNDSVVVLLGG